MVVASILATAEMVCLTDILHSDDNGSNHTCRAGLRNPTSYWIARCVTDLDALNIDTKRQSAFNFINIYTLRLPLQKMQTQKHKLHFHVRKDWTRPAKLVGWVHDAGRLGDRPGYEHCK